MKPDPRLVAVLALSFFAAACPSGSSSDRANVTWSRSFGGALWDEAAAALATSDGGYLFAGTTGALYDTRDVDDEDQLDGEVWLVKLDPAGNPSWERTYGEPFLSPAGNRVVYSLAADAGGGETWVAGVESASDVPTGNAQIDGGNLVVGRVDAAGDLLFRRIYDSGAFLSFPFSSPLDTTHEKAQALAVTPDGGLLVVCWLSARVDKPAEMRSRVEVNALWVLRLDAVGDRVWDIHLVQAGDGVHRDRFFPYHAGAAIHVDVCASDDGGGLVTAYSSAEPDTELVRLQSNGTLLWSKTRVDGHVRDAVAVDGDADGEHDDGFVLAGIDRPFDGGAGFLMRLDRSGDPLWLVTDGDVDGFECVDQGEYIDSGGLQMPAIGAAGVRGDGSAREGRILFVSLDGGDEAVIDPYVVLEAPEIRFELDRWRVLGIDAQSAFVNSFSRSRMLLETEILGRIPRAETAELLADGSVVDLARDAGSGDVVLTRTGPEGRLVLERVFRREGRFVERAHALVELESLDPSYAVLAETSSFGSRFEEPWLLILDGEGDILSQRILEDAHLRRSHRSERQALLVPTADGGLALAAVVDGHSRLVRLDSAGEEVWNSEPLAPGRSSGFPVARMDKTTALTVTADGGYLVVGSRADAGAWAARLSAEGAVVWRNEYEPVSGRPLDVTAVLTLAGGFVLAGVHDGEPFVLQIDDAGGLVRASFYPLGGADAGPVVRLAPAGDDGLLLATSWIDSDEPSGGIGDGAASTGRINVLLLRLDAELEPSWYRVYGGLYDEHLADLRPVPEGGWLVAARSDSLGDRGEAWLLRIDYEGLITEACNAYLGGGEWPGLFVPVSMAQAAFLPDVAPGELAPAELVLVETPAIPQVPPAAVVARQCFGFTPAGAPDEPPPGDGSFRLTVVFEGGGSGTVRSAPAGIDCRSTCSADFPAGTEVHLMPIVDDGFFFSHWEGCDVDSGVEGCLVVMDSDRTVTVYFE